MCLSPHVGTIRRFLEHYGEEIDVVVFAADSEDVSVFVLCCVACVQLILLLLSLH